MAYVGTPIDTTNQFQSLQGKRFSGDGSTTAFTLDIAPTSVFDIEVFVENVRQDPNSAYSLSGTTLTFTGAPASGTNNIYVVHQAKAVGTINPPDASVNSDKLTGNLVTPGTLDVNGQELILDADGDTSITADTDDQIDIKIGGADDFSFKANKFEVQSGSNIDMNGTELILDADADTSITADTDDQIDFKTGGTDRAKIDSSGAFIVGTYNNPATTNFGKVAASGIIQSGRTGTGSQPMIEFFNGNGVVGSIYTSGSGTSFNTSSDYRLKENVDYTFDATTRLKQLKPARFNFKADADTTVDGFLAHEVSSIVPEAITGEKDGVDEEGNPSYQGIDQSKLIPLLVKTIQELEARIAVLEG